LEVIVPMIKTSELSEQIAKYAIRFTNTSDLNPLIQEASKARFVLLGEASHGTSEFYTIRADISKMLIEEHGFTFIAVEGDWPACYEVNRYIKGLAPEYTSAEDVLRKAFGRWPSWMWANHEVVELIDWLHNYNQKQTGTKIGFYGIDVYSLWESMEAIVGYLKESNPPALEKALKAIECFEPFQRKPDMYGLSAALYGEDCMDEILDLLHTLQENKQNPLHESESTLNMNVNAMAVRNAEQYYHTMITDDTESWNVRDRHMVEALRYIGEFYGTTSKGIIWEHNTHIGDARATDMAHEGMLNVGQLVREEYGIENSYAIGFGTYEGTVIAAKEWGADAEVMPVPKGASGSWEEAFHQSGGKDSYMMFTEENRNLFRHTIGHRAIGVVYHPEYEQHGNYVPSRMAERYDAYIHVERTKALDPL